MLFFAFGQISGHKRWLTRGERIIVEYGIYGSCRGIKVIGLRQTGIDRFGITGSPTIDIALKPLQKDMNAPQQCLQHDAWLLLVSIVFFRGLKMDLNLCCTFVAHGSYVCAVVVQHRTVGGVVKKKVPAFVGTGVNGFHAVIQRAVLIDFLSLL